jgi:predicted component of type VI protein secretion system
MGNFSGCTRQGICEPETISAQRTLSVDRDDFDKVLARLRPRLGVPLGSSSDSLEFACFDDFHPDKIFERATLFQKLRQTRLPGPESLDLSRAETSQQTR